PSESRAEPSTLWPRLSGVQPREKSLTGLDSSDTIHSRYTTISRMLNTVKTPSWHHDFDSRQTRNCRRGKEREAMRKLRMLSLLGIILMLGAAPLAAQNSVDVLGGTQPTNTAGCAVNPNCIPATWSTTSNAGADITVPITANFVFDSNGGASPTDFPAATSGQICLADTRDLTGTTLFGQIAANCQLAGGHALMLIRDSAVTAPSTIPVFSISTANGTFLRTTVGFNATTGVSNFPIRINVAVAVAPSNPTGQHNCPNGQAVPAFVGPGTANYTPNESLCLPAGAGQAVEPS